MTIHEATDQLESLLGHRKTMRESGEIWARDCEALRIALAALRGPKREQVKVCDDYCSFTERQGEQNG